MGLISLGLVRPFRADEIMGTQHPGLRCAPPWAIAVRRFAAKGMMEALHPGLLRSALGYRSAPLRG